MSRLFFVFSYRTLKRVPGIVTRISSSKTSTIIFDLLNQDSFMPISRTLVWIKTRMIFSWPRSAWTLWARDLSGAVCHAPNQRTLATLPV
jgi:hypothetical protein